LTFAREFEKVSAGVEESGRGQGAGMARRTSTRISNRALALRRALTEPDVILWSRLGGRGGPRPAEGVVERASQGAAV